MGVFATRSPFRPNPIGLSCVRLDCVRIDKERGPVLSVSGIDMRNGTEIYDIKPYLPYSDIRPEATAGFAPGADTVLEVVFPPGLLERVPPEKRAALTGVLSCDPRPAYQKDPDRVYGLDFAGLNVRFSVCGQLLTVLDVRPLPAH